MSKSKLIISIVVILSIGIGILAGVYFYTKRTTQTNSVAQGDKTIFGGVGGVRTDLPTDNTNNVSSTEPSATDKPTGTTTPNASLLRKIATGPISGADFIIKDLVATTSSKTTSTTKSTKTVKPKVLGQVEKIRYMERGTGRIYETASSTLDTERITNSTFTKIIESFFDKKGDNVLIRDLFNGSDIIQTRLGVVAFEAPTSTSMSLKTKTLPYNMFSVVMSPERDFFASYIEQKGVGSLVNISRLDGTGVVNIYKSPFREWLLSWPNTNTVVLNTKPSAYSEGYAYSINTKTKAFKRLTGGQAGLTTLLSPDGLNVLVGESVEGSMKLSVLNIKTNSYKDVYARTLPEKCVWSKLEKSVLFCAASESIVYAPYPDAWYQGLVFFDDNIWKINTETQENKLLYVIKNSIKEGLDITNLLLDKNEDYLLFTNKKDLSLWGLQIEKPKKATSTTATKTKTLSN
jgi:hypothetical protein